MSCPGQADLRCPWPLVSLSFALGLSAAETGLVLGNLLRGFKAGGVLGHVAVAACVYALVFGAVDLFAARRGLAPRWRLFVSLVTLGIFGWLYNQFMIRRLPEDTVIIALSDHGDMMGEHGFYGHNTGLYEPIVRIAWVMAGPGLPVGRRLDAPVSIADVAPTALALLGLPGLEGVFGLDLGPAIRGEETLSGRLVYAEHPSPVYTTSGWRTRRPWHDWGEVMAARSAVTDGDQKRVLHSDGRDWAFDLNEDPGERAPGDGLRSGLPAPRVME